MGYERRRIEQPQLSWNELETMGRWQPGGKRAMPLWPRDDAKVRLVVAYRICISARVREVPTDLAGLRQVEQQYITKIGDGPSVQQHLQTIARFGGPIAYFTSLIYRYFRMRMNAQTLAEHYGVSPSVIRMQINRMCRIARALLPNAGDHLPFHHSAKHKELRSLYQRRPGGARTFDYARARDLRESGLPIRDVAAQLGVPRGRVTTALWRMGVGGPDSLGRCHRRHSC